jgi:uncharacterized membrane protein YGL010W
MTAVTMVRHHHDTDLASMTGLAQWLEAYAICHQHPANRIIHHICVPSIQFSLLGLLWLVPLPVPDVWPYALANLASLVLMLAICYYFILSWRIAAGMLLMSLLMLLAIQLIHSTGYLFEVSLVVFILAWAGQFWGHHIEGKKPSFFDDLRFLLIGPLWVLAHLYQRLGINVDRAYK